MAEEPNTTIVTLRVYRGPSPTDNCKTCAHAVDPKQSYGMCLRTHRYIHNTLQEDSDCGPGFPGWVQKRRWWLLWLI